MLRMGTLGSGTAWMSPANRFHRLRPSHDPERYPHHDPDADRNRRLPRHGGRQLRLGEPERLQQGQFTSAATDGRDQRQAEGDDCPGGQGTSEEAR